MGIRFLHPAVWLAAVAIGLPIAIHLLTLARRSPVRFPSIRFLETTRLSASSRHAIEDWPLLLLRIATVLLAVAALAGPVLVDARARSGLRVRGWRARSVLEDRTAAPEDELRSAAVARTFARQRLRDAVADGVRWLGQQEPTTREIVVLSAFRRGSTDAADFAAVPNDLGIRLVRTGDGSSRREREISRLLWRDGRVVRVIERITLTPEATEIRELESATLDEVPSSGDGVARRTAGRRCGIASGPPAGAAPSAGRPPGVDLGAVAGRRGAPGGSAPGATRRPARLVGAGNADRYRPGRDRACASAAGRAHASGQRGPTVDLGAGDCTDGCRAVVQKRRGMDVMPLVRTTQRRLRLSARLAGLASGLVALAAFAGVAGLAGQSPVVGMALGLLLAVGLTLTAWRWSAGRWTPASAASYIEARVPGLDNLVVTATALDLGAIRASDLMRGEVARHAAARVEAVDAGSIGPPGIPRVAARALERGRGGDPLGGRDVERRAASNCDLIRFRQHDCSRFAQPLRHRRISARGHRPSTTPNR